MMHRNTTNMYADPDACLLSATVPQGPDNDGVIHRFPISGTLAPGDHILAIPVHNTELPSSDLRLGGVTLVAVEPEAERPHRKTDSESGTAPP